VAFEEDLEDQLGGAVGEGEGDGPSPWSSSTAGSGLPAW
jgi:hypothetical protein